jgi:hypothetical protein
LGYLFLNRFFKGQSFNLKNPSKTAISSPVTGSLYTSHPTSHCSISLKYLLREIFVRKKEQVEEKEQ